MVDRLLLANGIPDRGVVVLDDSLELAKLRIAIDEQ